MSPVRAHYRRLMKQLVYQAIVERNDHARVRRGQELRDLVIGMDVVREAVQEHDRPPLGIAVLLVGDIQRSGFDVADHARLLATSSTAWANASGASWGTLCPMPLKILCACLPVNFLE